MSTALGYRNLMVPVYHTFFMKIPWKKILSSCGVVCLIWLLIKYDYKVVVATCTSISFGLLIKLIFLTIVLIAIKFYRWHFLLNSSLNTVPIMGSIKAYSNGLFWGILSPGRVGEISKCYMLKIEHGVAIAKTAPLLLVDRLYDLVIPIIFLVSAYLILIDQIQWAIIFALFVLAIIPVVKKNTLAATDKIIGLIRKAGFNKFDPILFKKAASIGFTSKGAKAFLITCIAMTVMVCQALMLLHDGYSLDFHITEIVFIVTLLNIASSIPVSLLGLGTNEAVLISAVMMLMPELFYPEKLLAFSLTLTFLLFIPAIFFSGILLVVLTITKWIN